MLVRHRREAEGLHATQKFKWEMKLRLLGLCHSRSSIEVDENAVPVVDVEEDFDLFIE